METFIVISSYDGGPSAWARSTKELALELATELLRAELSTIEEHDEKAARKIAKLLDTGLFFDAHELWTATQCRWDFEYVNAIEIYPTRIDGDSGDFLSIRS